MMVKRTRLFVIGFVAGMSVFVAASAITFISFKVGNRLIDLSERYLSKKNYKKKQIVFPISFEKQNEWQIFETNEASSVISDNFASDGKGSLLVEFPAGVSMSTLVFEVFGKECLDWSEASEFAVDVFNSTEATAYLELKIKSGSKYPKRVFEKSIRLPAGSKSTIKVNIDELKNKLDVSKISYLNFFMQDPTTTFLVYFDNMRLIKDN
jgi:hypothetical protein